MDKNYTESELRAMGLNDDQIKAFMGMQRVAETSTEDIPKSNLTVIKGNENVQLHHHDVEIKGVSSEQLVPTSLEQIASYKEGVVVPLPPFADGQPFVARMVRPSMLGLVKSGKIPNKLLNQATSLFANGAAALNNNGKNFANLSDLFEVVDVIVDAALKEPTLKDIRSVGMDLSDDQLMAIFSYTQNGVKALEQFRTK